MRACGREYRVASRELTELSARARTSAWLPALRVRGGRNTDETLRLTPTDAEPDRFQLVGGDDYRFEGQLSWDFRRLVFANEELAVERLRRGLDAERWKRQQQAMKALQRWLAAWVQIDDETRLPEERVASWVSERGARAELDWLSHGWFSRWAPRATSRIP